MSVDHHREMLREMVKGAVEAMAAERAEEARKLEEARRRFEARRTEALQRAAAITLQHAIIDRAHLTRHPALRRAHPADAHRPDWITDAEAWRKAWDEVAGLGGGA